MNRGHFEVAKLQLSTRAELIDAVYSPLASGSWYVTVKGTPARRLTWDGKEGWLVVEEETADIRAGLSVWRDLLINRHAQGKDLAEAINCVLHGLHA